MDVTVENEKPAAVIETIEPTEVKTTVNSIDPIGTADDPQMEQIAAIKETEIPIETAPADEPPANIEIAPAPEVVIVEQVEKKPAFNMDEYLKEDFEQPEEVPAPDFDYREVRQVLANIVPVEETIEVSEVEQYIAKGAEMKNAKKEPTGDDRVNDFITSSKTLAAFTGEKMDAGEATPNDVTGIQEKNAAKPNAPDVVEQFLAGIYEVELKEPASKKNFAALAGSIQ